MTTNKHHVFLLAADVQVAQAVANEENWPREELNFINVPVALRGTENAVCILHHSFFARPLDEIQRWAEMFKDRKSIVIKMVEDVCYAEPK